MKSVLRLAAICMTTTSDKARNVETALRLVKEAAKQGAEWVQLPEMFAFMGTYDKVYEMAELEGGPTYRALSAAAKEHGIVLFGGTQGERPDNDNLPKEQLTNAKGERRVFNTLYVFGRNGEKLAKYRKTHLFNLIPQDGGTRYCESDGFIPGEHAVACDIDGLRVALTVCYDLRFPDFYSKLERQGHPDVIAVPSAFTKGTGQAHWELLLRARAVERQAYVFAANQTGQHAPGKESYGHSIVIDPWGTVLADTGDEEGLALAELSRAKVAEVRAKLPALQNRRPSLY